MEKMEKMENDIIDITKLNIMEIKVNNDNEIFMIKSSDKDLIQKNKLLCNDLLPYIATSSPPSLTGSSSSSAPKVSLFSDMKILLYNPELSTEEIGTFMRSPGKYSFMDEVIINKNILQENKATDNTENTENTENIIDIVGPKTSFLVDELTVFVIHYQ